MGAAADMMQELQAPNAGLDDVAEEVEVDSQESALEVLEVSEAIPLSPSALRAARLRFFSAATAAAPAQYQPREREASRRCTMLTRSGARCKCTVGAGTVREADGALLCAIHKRRRTSSCH